MTLCSLLGIEEPQETVDEEIIEEKKLTPFDFVNAISYSKENLFEISDDIEKSYNSYVINRAMSFSADMVLFANEMNHYYQIPVRQQFDFLSSSIRKKKRYDKWVKAEKESETITLIKKYYNYSNEKAKQVLPLLSDEHIEFIKSKMNQGGITTRKRK